MFQKQPSQTHDTLPHLTQELVMSRSLLCSQFNLSVTLVRVNLGSAKLWIITVFLCKFQSILLKNGLQHGVWTNFCSPCLQIIDCNTSYLDLWRSLLSVILWGFITALYFCLPLLLSKSSSQTKSRH